MIKYDRGEDFYTAIDHISDVLDNYDEPREIVVVFDRTRSSIDVITSQSLRTRDGRAVDAALLNTPSGVEFRRDIDNRLLDGADVQYAELAAYRSDVHCTSCFAQWLANLKLEVGDTSNDKW